MAEFGESSNVGHCGRPNTRTSIRPAGLSNDGSDEDEDHMDAELIATLQSIYYSDVEDEIEERVAQRKTRQDDDEKHGWIYRVTFDSGLTHEFTILTKFLVFCNFQNYDEQQSIEQMCRELLNCCWQHGQTTQIQLEYELFAVGVRPANFLPGLRHALTFTKHDLVYV